MITIEAFRGTAGDATPPAGVGPALEALWWAGRGDWEQAHNSVQQHEGDPACDLVHAHLHRQEGDAENAAYWYRRAGRTLPAVSLDDEWTGVATELLARPRPAMPGHAEV